MKLRLVSKTDPIEYGEQYLIRWDCDCLYVGYPAGFVGGPPCFLVNEREIYLESIDELAIVDLT